MRVGYVYDPPDNRQVGSEPPHARPRSEGKMKVGAAGLGECCRLLRSAVFYILVGMLPAHAQDVASLKARYATLHEQLASNQFQRPLSLESSEHSGELQ